MGAQDFKIFSPKFSQNGGYLRQNFVYAEKKFPTD